MLIQKKPENILYSDIIVFVTTCILFITTGISFGEAFVESKGLSSGNAYFHKLLEPVIEHHERIQVAQEAVLKAREQIRISLGGRYPKLDLKIEAGREDNSGKIDPEHYNDINLKLNQLLWDFGKTDATIEKSRRELKSSELNLQKVRQKFILDAVMAYQKLHRAYKVLQFTMESEENIRHQTGLEEIRVAEGFGYTTDVLQSKSQLASTISRRLRNEGDYYMAQSAYLETFDTLPDNIDKLRPLDMDQCITLAEDLNAILEIALRQNIELQLARNQKKIAEIELQKEKDSALFPDINFTLEGSIAENYDAVFGSTKDYKAMVTLKKSINLGLTEKNKISAASHNLIKERHQVADRERIIEKTVRMAWHRLKTVEATTQTLAQQAQLTAAFLELARKERALGNRSLMDILAGETSLINAKSDSYVAKTDISLAICSLLETTGQLELEMFKKSKSNNESR